MVPGGGTIDGRRGIVSKLPQLEPAPNAPPSVVLSRSAWLLHVVGHAGARGLHSRYEPARRRQPVTPLLRNSHAATYDVYSLRTDGTDVRRLTTNVDAYAVSWR